MFKEILKGNMVAMAAATINQVVTFKAFEVVR
jgi:hypothetical protein